MKFFFYACLLQPTVFGLESPLLKKLTDPTPLASVVMVSGPALDLFVTRLESFGDTGLIIFAIQDKRIVYYDFQSKKVELVAREGGGPGEFRGGFLYGSVIGEEVMVLEWDTQKIKAFSRGGTSRIVSEPSCYIRSLISIKERFIVGVIATPGAMFYSPNLIEQKAPEDSLIFFEKGKGKQLWQSQGTFFNRDFADDESFDNAFAIKLDLFPIRNEARYYRVPYYASPTFQVMDISGQVVREIPIPHPFASQTPQDVNGRLRLKKSGKALRHIADACVDSLGDLHVLLANIQDAEGSYEGRLGVVLDEYGTIKSSFIFDRAVKRFVISPDLKTYYGIDSEEDALLAFPIR